VRDLWKGNGRGAGSKHFLCRFFFGSCLFLICLLPLVLTGCQDAAVASTGLTVIMTTGEMGMSGGFSPRELHIFAGQTVTWVNKGTSHHTVTADNNSFNSGFVETGASYTHRFLLPGTYPYHCVLHGSELGSGMAGVIVVNALPPTVQPSQ
jgi:plastocyanin